MVSHDCFIHSPYLLSNLYYIMFTSSHYVEFSHSIIIFPIIGCLLQYLRQKKELVVEKSELILDMAYQIGSAMFYLEKNGFIHRDLVSEEEVMDIHM